ncbi:hypothetical protein PVAP13_1NG484500 [Panicum virgatum]|uniref:Uncharacterized protein n=1 Tax=Panicum virgatum TaxID=38727 RepID=A0A8T0X652_PANVG|nr:hypothetical protein PVAP13_1NG484500 [Panicum virgatum]
MWDAYKGSSKLAAKAHLAHCSISFRGASISGTSYWRALNLLSSARSLGGRMAKRNGVKKSIWDFLCGCSSPRTT